MHFFDIHVKKIILYCTIVSVIFGVCMYIYNQPTFNKGKDAYLDIVYNMQHSNSSILILGDSHAYYAFPNDITKHEDILNVSYPGEGLTEMYLKLQYAEKHMKHLNMIIVPIDFHDFSTYRAQFTNKSYGLYYASRDIYNATYSEHYSPLQYFLYQKLPLIEPSQRTDFVRKTINTIVSSYGEDTNKSTNQHQETWSTEITNSEYKRITRQLSGDLTVAELIKTKKDIIAFAHKHDMIVVGVQYPIAPEYREIANKFDIESVTLAQKKLAYDYIFDYRTMFDTSPEYFLNADHLNKTGASKLSTILLTDLQDYLEEN